MLVQQSEARTVIVPVSTINERGQHEQLEYGAAAGCPV